MLDENIRQNLRKVLEEKMGLVRFEREGLEKLKMQIYENEEQIHAIKKLLGDEETEISQCQGSFSELVAMPVGPRIGTVTDEIRLLFEENPNITCKEVIQRVRSKFSRSKISPQSFSIWNGYFKHGRYRMDKEKYRIRYGQDPPY